MCLVSLDSLTLGFSYMCNYYWKESKEVTLGRPFLWETKARQHHFSERIKWCFLKTFLSEVGKHLSENQSFCQILYLLFNIFVKAGWEIWGQLLPAVVLPNFLSKNPIHFSLVSCLQTQPTF